MDGAPERHPEEIGEASGEKEPSRHAAVATGDQAEIAELVELVPEDSRSVLDLTCGGGQLGAALKRRAQLAGRRCAVTGADDRVEPLEVARGRLDEVVKGNPIRVAFRWQPKTFDAVVAPGTFDLIDDPPRLAGYVFHWVKPSGTVVARVADRAGIPVGGESGRDLVSVLAGAGLTVASTTTSVTGGMIVVARRPSELDAYRPVRDVSVVLVVKDRLAQLKSFLSSLATSPQQTTFEVIIVDDASSDAVASMRTDEDGTVVVVHREQPEGLVAGLDAAARVAHSKLLAFLNPGLELGAGFLAKVAASMLEARRELGAIVPMVLSPDGKVASAGFEVEGATVANPHRGLALVDPAVSTRRGLSYLPLGSCIVRRTAYEMVWGVDTSLDPDRAGLDLAAKMLDAGWELAYEPGLRLVDRSPTG